MNKNRTRKMKRAAGKAPRWVRDIAAAHFDPQGNRQFRESKLGTFGAASEVRKIDPRDFGPAPSETGEAA